MKNILLVSFLCCVSVVFAQVSSFPYSESFESGMGVWLDWASNDYDWQTNSGGTGTSSTGPSGASDGSNYIYAEANGQSDGDLASVYAEFDLTGNYSSASFSFDFHMYSNNSQMGEFEVYVYDGAWNLILDYSGSQGNAWITETIDLTPYIGNTIYISFDAIRGSGNKSDIAVDNIELTVVNATSSSSGSTLESFENSFDGWSNGATSDFDWVNNSGSTNSGTTGPSAASDGTYYMYTEVSSPVGNSQFGYLEKQFDLTQMYLYNFQFDYHMYGSMINEFSFQVSTNAGASYTTLFSQTGDQGDFWTTQEIDLSAYFGQLITLRFVVETPSTGSVWQGDVAVDNVNYDYIDISNDFDADGVVDYFDLDDDNDGVPDTEEMSDSTLNFSGGNGGSTFNFSIDDVNDMVLDFLVLDNSMSLTVNGNDLNSNNVLQLENVGAVAGEVIMVFQSDGALITTPWVSNTNGLPRFRIIINEFGLVQAYGSRNTSSTTMELMEPQDGSSFNIVPFTSGTNSFELVNPDDLGADNIAATAVFARNIDTDGDGDANKQDLDSDGDGCSDAYESGATTDETSDYQFNDVSGDEDGLSPSVDAGNDGSVDYTVNPNFLDATTYTCCPNPLGIDTDGDGVDNGCDQDDDNDGILDVSEYGGCIDATSAYIGWGVHYTAGGTSQSQGDDPATASPLTPLEYNGTVTVAYQRTENITSQGETAHYKVNDFYVNDGFTLYQEALNNARSVHTFTFSEPVYNLDFTIYDIDRGASGTTSTHFQDYIQIELITSDGNSYGLSSGEYSTNSSNEYIGNNTFRGINEDNGSVEIISIQEWITEVTITYYNGIPASQYSFTDGNAQGSAFSNFTFCTPYDSDEDGIIDAKEVDSDGDLCPDAIEVGFTYNDIHLSGGSQWQMDTVVDTYGIPLGAGVVTNGFVTNTSSQGPNCEGFFVLAVDLISFDARPLNDDVLLNWVTLSEHENELFEVMWRTPDSDWQMIGTVEGAGFSESELNYDFLHTSPARGENYYQLRAVDFNGLRSLSDVKKVVFDGEDVNLILYPNPNSGSFNLVNVDYFHLENVEVVNMQGQICRVQIEENETGKSMKISHNLSAGIYLFRIQNKNGEVQQLKFIVQ